MSNPLLEATVVRAGTRIMFRHSGAMVDPIRRQLVFDFERAGQKEAATDPAPLLRPETAARPNLQERFVAAVQAEEAGDKQKAIELYHELVRLDPTYAAAYINLGTLYFHQRQYGRAEELYRQATVVDPTYVLAFFDLGNVLDELDRLDESIEAYRHAVVLAPQYADAHYNLALAYERRGALRNSLRHCHSYVNLDRNGPWSEHARGQIRKLLAREKLSIAWRAEGYVPRSKPVSALAMVKDEG